MSAVRRVPPWEELEAQAARLNLSIPALPEASSALCSIEGCWWTASGPWSHRAGHEHHRETGHTWTLFQPTAST